MDFCSIGQRIKHARIKKDLTQEQLAEMINVSRHHISLIETGAKGISLETLVNISNMLQVPISELLSDNLTVTEKDYATAISRALLDCTEQEEQIIIRTVEALKAILFEFGI